MDTRTALVTLADQLIRARGYNAFSFKDLSETLGISTASIHYHFATKADLGRAVIELQFGQLSRLKNQTRNKTGPARLKAFMSIYNRVKAENRICLVGAMGSDYLTFGPELQEAVKKMAAEILQWVTGILEDGRREGAFFFEGSARTRALMIITNMLAAVQLTRLTSEKDFERIQRTIIKELIP